jgi:hypothetical protein
MGGSSRVVVGNLFRDLFVKSTPSPEEHDRRDLCQIAGFGAAPPALRACPVGPKDCTGIAASVHNQSLF